MKLTHVVEYIRPGGGPYGYLYNLKKAVLKYPTDKIKIEAAYETDRKDDPYIQSGMAKVLEKYERFLPSCLIAIVFMFWYFRPNKHRSMVEKVCKSDSFLIFHSMPLLRLSLKYNNNIYVMSHSPVSPVDELINTIISISGGSVAWAFVRFVLRRYELGLLEKINGIVIPSEGSIDGYYTDDPNLVERLKKIRRIIIPTGVAPLEISKDSGAIRKELCVSDSVVVGYFGRYVKDKGYDLFIDLVKSMNGVNSGVKFISAGSGVLALEKSNKIINDLGFVNNIADYINSVDFVIVPNRVAYFDLIILECLSIGKTVITTDVGGSRCLPKKSVYIVDENNFIDNAIDIVMSREMLDSQKVISDYEKYYSELAFVNSYIKEFKL